MSDVPDFPLSPSALVYRDGILATLARKVAYPESMSQVFVYRIDVRGRPRHIASLQPAGISGCSERTSLALEHGTLVVGSPCQAGGGAVHVYTENGNHWIERATLVASDPQPNAQFGAAVDLRDGLLAVGAPGADGISIPEIGTGIGAGYLFKRHGQSWVQSQKVHPDYDAVGLAGNFGAGVAINKDHVTFSAPGSTTGRLADRAQVDAYKWSGQSLVYDQMFSGNLNFGAYLHAAGNWLLIGLPGDPYGQESVFFFDFHPRAANASADADADDKD
jgi:hypothetical protein